LESFLTSRSKYPNTVDQLIQTRSLVDAVTGDCRYCYAKSMAIQWKKEIKKFIGIPLAEKSAMDI
jgi:hypothetical protein